MAPQHRQRRLLCPPSNELALTPEVVFLDLLPAIPGDPNVGQADRLVTLVARRSSVAGDADSIGRAKKGPGAAGHLAGALVGDRAAALICQQTGIDAEELF